MPSGNLLFVLQSEQHKADSGEQQQLTWEWAMPRKAFAEADLVQIKC